MLTHPQLQTFVCLFFNLLFFLWLCPGASCRQEALQGSQALWWVWVFFFYHVNIMCPQNSRKGSCICDCVMDFPDRCHLSRPWGGDLHLPPPNGVAASAVNTFFACGDAETWSKFLKENMFISKKQNVDAGNTYKTKIKYNFLIYLSSAKFWKNAP